MAKHGATGSTFSDWWAYKIEVIDAIPFNGALMHQQKIIVSFNSDDDELGRHLNHEAAKAMKYGGVPREDAYYWVQRNALKSWDEGLDFRTLVKADADITAKLTPEQIEKAFDVRTQLKNVDRIFERVFGGGVTKYGGALPLQSSE